MKRLINILIVSATLVGVAASCQKEDGTSGIIDPAIAGEWHLTEILAEGTLVSEDLDSYLLINIDGTFELYQKSGSQTFRYDRFTGTCAYEDNLLSGVYSNGQPWGSKYSVSLAGDMMTLLSFNLLEVQKYQKMAIPESVKKDANTITRSGAVLCAPIL